MLYNVTTGTGISDYIDKITAFRATCIHKINGSRQGQYPFIHAVPYNDYCIGQNWVIFVKSHEMIETHFKNS